MKIRTLLIASIVTFSVLLLIIAGLVIVTNQQIGKLVGPGSDSKHYCT